MRTVPRKVLIVAGLIAGVTLNGCGGGGGGGGLAATSGGTQTYARLIDSNLDVDLATLPTNFTTHGGATTLTPQNGTVAAHLSTDAAAQPTIRIDVAGVDGLSFSETFAPSDLVGTTLFPGTASAISVVIGTKVASDASVRGITFVAPAAGQFEYSTLGAWGYDLGTRSYGGFVSAGIPTRGADLPPTGSAAYTGLSIAAYSDGSAIHSVGAVASATADFAARSVSFATTNSRRVNVLTPTATPVADFGLNLNGTLSYPAGTNSISGTVTAQNGMTGSAQARFYGPAAAELGGVFRLGATGRQMEGGFMTRR